MPYPESERIRLVKAWDAAGPGQRAALARTEGTTINRLSQNVKRWRDIGVYCCGRDGCPNMTPPGQTYCSNRCAGAAHRTPDKATAPLARFLQHKLSERGLTRSELAELIGVSPGSVTDWLKGRCLPGQAAYKRLSTVFRDIPEHEPGDSTERRQQMMRRVRRPDLALTPAAIAKSAKSRRGLSTPSEAKKSAVRRRYEATPPADWQAFRQAGSRPDAVARRALAKRLRHHQGPLDKATVESWAHETAVRPSVRLPERAVIELWRPLLADRGVKWGGRPRKASGERAAASFGGEGVGFVALGGVAPSAQGSKPVGCDPADGVGSQVVCCEIFCCAAQAGVPGAVLALAFAVGNLPALFPAGVTPRPAVRGLVVVCVAGGAAGAVAGDDTAGDAPAGVAHG